MRLANSTALIAGQIAFNWHYSFYFDASYRICSQDNIASNCQTGTQHICTGLWDYSSRTTASGHWIRNEHAKPRQRRFIAADDNVNWSLRKVQREELRATQDRAQLRRIQWDKQQRKMGHDQQTFCILRRYNRDVRKQIQVRCPYSDQLKQKPWSNHLNVRRHPGFHFRDQGTYRECAASGFGGMINSSIGSSALHLERAILGVLGAHYGWKQFNWQRWGWKYTSYFPLYRKRKAESGRWWREMPSQPRPICQRPTSNVGFGGT